MANARVRPRTPFFLLTVGVCACSTLGAQAPAPPWGLSLQPWPGLRIDAGGEELKPALRSRDNSLARAAIGAAPGSALLISAEGYAPRVVVLPGAPSEGGGSVVGERELGLVALSPAGSEYRLAAAFRTGTQPKAAAFIDRRRVAVPLLDGPGVDVFDLEAGTSRRIAPPEPYARLGGFVECLVISERAELWVSQMTAAAAHVFSLPDLAYKATVRSGGTWSKVLAWDPASRRVYLSNWVSEDLSVIDPERMIEERRVKVGAVPRGMALWPGGAFMYLAQYEIAGAPRGRLLKLDLATMAIVASIGPEGSKRHVVADPERGRVYVSDMARDLVEIYDARQDRLLADVKVGGKPNTIALSSDGRLLYVSCRGPNNPDRGYLYKGYEMGRIYVVDLETLSVVEWWEGGNQPTGLAVSPDGALIASTDFLDARLRVHRRLGHGTRIPLGEALAEF